MLANKRFMHSLMVSFIVSPPIRVKKRTCVFTKLTCIISTNKAWMQLIVVSPSTEIQKVPKHNFRHIQPSEQYGHSNNRLIRHDFLLGFYSHLTPRWTGGAAVRLQGNKSADCKPQKKKKTTRITMPQIIKWANFVYTTKLKVTNHITRCVCQWAADSISLTER